MSEQTAVRWERGDDGIVVLTLDDPNQSANTMNDLFRRSFTATMDRLETERDNIVGVVITSAKSTFFAGADLRELITVDPDDAETFFTEVEANKRQFRRLERLGRPVVAAVAGAALGGGFEILLASHHRVVVDDPRIKLGLPEVTLGLLPGGGGVVRTVRMLGLEAALTKVLLQGQQMSPQAALDLGLVDELVGSPDELLDRARTWITANPEASQPWDRPGYKIPGGTPSSPKLAAMLPAYPANLRKQLKGADYPAPKAILAAAVEGAQVDVDTALRIESRYFTSLATGQIAKNMTKAFFFDLQHIKSGGSRPAGPAKYSARKVGVLGAGMMGSGIAYAFANRGVEVVLKDVSLEAAERGKAYSAKVLDKAVARGRRTPEQRDDVLGRITPTEQMSDLAGCDVVIEAVFEDPKLKHDVFGQVEQVVSAETLLCSNTSTLPITGLAAAVSRPADFIGMHFFSPVDKMQLVELITGAQTSQETLARAFDIVQQIGKIPIVVGDSRGFFTSRVIGTFIYEGMAMVAEGLNPVSIERAATQAGFPVGTLQLIDELTLTLNQRIRNATRSEMAAAGQTYQAHPGEVVLDRMLEEFGRAGRSSGAGFYDYPESGRTLWPGLWEHFVREGTEIPFEDMKERFLFIQAIETVKCIDEGVIKSVADANIGSIFGIGYPAWTGGVVQYMNQYDGGLAGFVARATELAERYGDRFTPPPLLLKKAENGERFE